MGGRTPGADRGPSPRGEPSLRGGRFIARPTRLRFGRDRDLHVFICRVDPGHPPRWLLA
ncbi:hypothetical protein [Streptomyces subrutilus]|uniref:hypothetical protein n=1 Tax=Streptomyces subrutilus TaxID=36818 RepID=UPI00340D2765